MWIQASGLRHQPNVNSTKLPIYSGISKVNTPDDGVKGINRYALAVKISFTERLLKRRKRR